MNALKRVLGSEAWLLLVTGLIFQTGVLVFPDTAVSNAEFTAYVFPTFAALALIARGGDAAVAVRGALTTYADKFDFGNEALKGFALLESKTGKKFPVYVKAGAEAILDSIDKEFETPKVP